MANSDWTRVAAAAAPRSACECCGILPSTAAVPGFDGFKCRCADEVFCRGCNCCLKHCRCKGVPEVDLPMTHQLAETRREWRRMGVKV